jgi:hypothetical protein
MDSGEALGWERHGLSTEPSFVIYWKTDKGAEDEREHLPLALSLTLKFKFISCKGFAPPAPQNKENKKSILKKGGPLRVPVSNLWFAQN